MPLISQKELLSIYDISEKDCVNILKDKNDEHTKFLLINYYPKALNTMKRFFLTTFKKYLDWKYILLSLCFFYLFYD